MSTINGVKKLQILYFSKKNKKIKKLKKTKKSAPKLPGIHTSIVDYILYFSFEIFTKKNSNA